MVQEFIHRLNKLAHKPFSDLFERQFAGVSFIYVKLHRHSRTEFENCLQIEARQFIQGTDWSFEFSYIRTYHDLCVYRFQFSVPNEKSFCCGNQCPDCILLKSRN
jgi:hypothetical protein